MSEYVRVRDAVPGREFSVSKELAETFPDSYTVLDKPGADSTGNPLPPKYTPATLAKGKKKASEADEPKEKSDG